jgi:glucose-1-phosphate cytidylyltransferase
MFLANYADGLTDLDLGSYVESFVRRKKIACFVSVPAPHTFHIVHCDAEQHATKLEHVTESSVRINGGFFVFRKEIFECLEAGEELVMQPFARLMARRQLLAVPYDGFWRNMDTFKDKMQLDEILAQGRGPWQVWMKR